MNFDRFVVESLNDALVRWSPLERVAVWAVNDLPFVLVATLVLGGLVAAFQSRRRGELPFCLIEGALTALIALAVGMAINQLIGAPWFRPRPYDAIAGLHQFVAPSPDPSFPSDHATAALSLAIGIGVGVPWLRNVLLAESVPMLLSRVAVGLHYPSDMVAGLLIAFVAVAIARVIAFQIRRPLYAIVAPMTSWLAPLDLPSPSLGSQGWVLLTGGLFSALVGIPMLAEAAVDPVRFHPDWLEHVLLGAVFAGLAGLCLFVVRRTAALRAGMAAR